MDFVGTSLISLTQPSGFWVSILNCFKGGVGSYILAVILLAVIVRIIFSVVDVFNKKINMKNMQINEKMKPELEAVQKKYANDKVMLQQKQQEIYKKYQFNMMGSCLPMLVMMVLQMVVFLTLWSSLQTVSNFNIATQYENTKTVYTNVLLLNENEEVKATLNSLTGSQYDIDIKIDLNAETPFMNVKIIELDGGEHLIENISVQKELNNQQIDEIIKKYAYVEPDSTDPGDEEDVGGQALTELNLQIKEIAERIAAEYYFDSQESFLWIKNVYKSESPTSPVFSKNEIKSYLSNFYTEEEKKWEEEFKYEDTIFDYVTAGINEKDAGVNGYYILVILAVLTSFLSLWLSNKLMKNSTAANQGKMMYFVMPVILGIFTLMYTSLFALYIIVGQIVMIALTPLTNLIVRKWNEASLKKKESKIVEVDYRRKDK